MHGVNFHLYGLNISSAKESNMNTQVRMLRILELAPESQVKTCICMVLLRLAKCE